MEEMTELNDDIDTRAVFFFSQQGPGNHNNELYGNYWKQEIQKFLHDILQYWIKVSIS